MKSESVAVRVARGIAWLNRNHDADWYWKIDLSIFDIHSPCACIGGQLYGGYGTMISVLDKGNDLPWIIARGFHGLESDYKKDTDALNAKWRKAITKLRIHNLT